MRARTHAMANGVRGLTRITRGVDTCTNDPVNLTEGSAIPHAAHGIAKNLQQLIEQPIVFRR